MDAEPIDTGATVSVPDGEVTHDHLVRILEDSRKSEPAEGAEPVASDAEAEDESKPDPQTERIAARVLAATKVERRAAKVREEQRARAADLDAREARIKLIEEDPVRFFEESKVSPKAFLEKLAGEQSPESLTAKEIASIKRELEAERAARLEDRKLREDLERQTKWQSVEAQSKQAAQQFVEHIAEKADAYPHLTEEFTPDEIVAHGFAVAEKHGEAYRKQYGDYPSDDVIAEYLEEQAKARAEARAAWRQRVGKGASPSQGTPAKQGLQQRAATTPRTLTNGGSTQRGAAPKPWSQADADAESLRIMNQYYATRSET
jgi:exonuclease VII large subunit